MVGVTDSDFLRFCQNFSINPTIMENDLKIQYKNSLKMFAVENTSTPPSDSNEPDLFDIKSFLNPTTVSSLKLDMSNSPPTHIKCLQQFCKSTLFNGILKNCSIGLSSSLLQKNSLIKNVLDSKNSNDLSYANLPSSHHHNSSSTTSSSNCNHHNESKYITRYYMPSDSRMPYPGKIINVDWSSDGKFIICCYRQRILLGDVNNMSFVACITGDFRKITCHPIYANVFATIVNSHSIVIYEISERSTNKSGKISYNMKIMTEMKFSSIKLADNILCWSPSGRYINACSCDRGVYVLILEDTPNDGVHCNRSTSRLVRIRKSLRIVAYRKVTKRIIATSFGNKPSLEFTPNNLFSILPWYRMNLINKSQDDIKTYLKNSSDEEYLYIAVEKESFIKFEITKQMCYSEKPVSLNSIPLSISTDVLTLSFDIDPFHGRLIVMSDDSGSLTAVDLISSTVIGLHSRLPGIVTNISISSGGLIVAWSLKLSHWCYSTDGDSDTKSQQPNIVAISMIRPFHLLWKVEVSGTVTSLKWHPWLPLLSITYEKHSYVSSFSRHLNNSTWNATNHDGSPSSGVMIINFY